MAPYQVTIAYDGTEYFGFQRQKSHRTVQGAVENALKKIGWIGSSITFSGRTDTGVHAENQVIGFELDWRHGEDDLKRALNSLLPMDIAVREIKLTDTEFHPRFSAKARQYRYQMVFSPDRHPVFDRYYWRVWPVPNDDLICEAVSRIIGTHDFESYGRPAKKGGSTIRTVSVCEWQRIEGDKAILSIKAESFLYHMVRRMVFLLVMVGQGKINAIDLELNFNGEKELLAGIAPANGLFLEKVDY